MNESLIGMITEALLPPELSDCHSGGGREEGHLPASLRVLDS